MNKTEFNDRLLCPAAEELFVLDKFTPKNRRFIPNSVLPTIIPIYFLVGDSGEKEALG